MVLFTRRRSGENVNVERGYQSSAKVEAVTYSLRSASVGPTDALAKVGMDEVCRALDTQLICAVLRIVSGLFVIRQSLLKLFLEGSKGRIPCAPIRALCAF